MSSAENLPRVLSVQHISSSYMYMYLLISLSELINLYYI